MLRRLTTARVPHMPVLIANLIYSRRLVARGDLVPVGEEIEADLTTPRTVLVA